MCSFFFFLLLLQGEGSRIKRILIETISDSLLKNSFNISSVFFFSHAIDKVIYRYVIGLLRPFYAD